MRFFNPVRKKERPKDRLDKLKPPYMEGYYKLVKEERKKKKDAFLRRKRAKDYIPGDCRYKWVWSTLIIPKSITKDNGDVETLWLQPCRVIQVMMDDRSWRTIDFSSSLL